MTTQSTIDKLIEMRLTSMSDAFLTQLQDARMKDLSFEDRFGMLVDIEYSNRKSNSLKRLIRNAGFDQPDAYIGDINYTSGRKLNRSLIERLATCEYITEHRNLFITGATGSGKTYMACAFVLWSSIFVTLMANKIGGLQFGIYRNCQISSRVFHTAVAALPLTKANRSDFE